MKIFISGAAGFIASNLSEALIADHSVVGIENFDPFYDRKIKEKNLELLKLSPNFKLYEGDMVDPVLMNRIFNDNDFDLVIHLAAKAGVRPSIEDPEGYVKTNINGTVNILEAAKKQGVRNFVFASSSSIYGNNKSIPFKESDPVDKPISPYAATKKACELICNTYAHLNGMSIACLRFFTVYGRRQRPDLAISKFTKMIDRGEAIPVFGDGTTERDYTYIDDIIDGIVKAAKYTADSPDGNCEIFNIGESNTVTLTRLIELIENAVGKKAVIDRMPMQPGDVVRTYADVSKAKSTFGYAPKTDIESGIQKYVAYYREMKK
ncbi:MAG: GDP-mannose 4,6-dehydratase [Candidatus Kapabacteria bacterium]|jgi:UDP-glucuronate 4-epimerase|nr:GDP-mannose 4,6-dehydratase [Candidatus Kapabacteria bacterium]